MPRRRIGQNVFDAAIDRMAEIYGQGHRVVVSFSAGKDSGACLEICVIAASMTGRLPVEVVLRDEEIMFPGTYEYAERTAQRPEISFNWLIANQPIINVFNREMPYFWVFDPLLDPSEWVRQPPSIAYKIPHKNIEMMTIPERFPPAPGKELYACIGLRVAESRSRMMGLFASGGHITKPNRFGVRSVRPIYDWTDGDIWKAHLENKWDYNSAYDVMMRLGVARSDLRIAPPSMNGASVKYLTFAQRAWPQWFERVANRLPGIRTAAQFGIRAVQPYRRLNETWEQCFRRTCIDEAPAWIAERAKMVAEHYISVHSHHSSSPFPDVQECPNCRGSTRSWKKLAYACYNGDPFSVKFDSLPYVEPEFFRAGAGTWGGTPSF